MPRNYVDFFSGINVPKPHDFSEEIKSKCGEELWNTDPLTTGWDRNQPIKITPAKFKEKLKTIVEAYKNSSKNIPIFVIGPPGVGKTEIVNEVGKEYDLEIHTYIASTMDPTEVIGLPFRDRGKEYVVWYPDREFVQPNSAKNHLYFFDELNMAPPSTQAAFYRLILEGRVGNIDISDALRIGAGNRLGDFEYVQRLGLPMATRFQIYLLQPSMSEWMDWAMKNDINPFIMKYVSMLDTTLDCDPRWFCINSVTPSLARATPRSWVRLSKLLDIGLDGKDDIYGSLGVLPGSVFYEWYDQVKPLVSKEKMESAGMYFRHGY